MIPFIDLEAQRRRLGERLTQAIMAAVAGGQYILGPQVAEFERQLAAFTGAKHVIAVANGTDAIALSLLSLGIRPRDAVICPAFTFAATAEAIAWLGAVPVFADIDPDTFTLDPAGLPAALETARQRGLTPKAVLAVDLFGHLADYAALAPWCAANGLALVCDAAQACGSRRDGRRAGSFGDVTTFSFFPAKPLGCYGDGGAIALPDGPDSDSRAQLLRSLRFHGRGDDKYDNVRIGMNSRLDTLQAAILLEKLAIFEEELAARSRIAERYSLALGGVLEVPKLAPGVQSAWAQYTIRVPAATRAHLMRTLAAEGVPSMIYYPRPLHRQTAYRHYPVAGPGLPVSDKAAAQVLSLPLHPYLDGGTQDRIIALLLGALKTAPAPSSAG